MSTAPNKPTPSGYTHPMRTTSTLTALLLAALFTAACSEQPASSGTEQPAAGQDHEGHGHEGHDHDDHEGHDHETHEDDGGLDQDDHAGHDHGADAGLVSADTGTVTAAGLMFSIPDGWSKQPPSNPMRIAQLAAANEGGTAFAAFSVARGGADANVMRWAGQFSNPDGDVLQSREDTTISGRAVTLVEMTGEYRGMGTAPAQPDTTMFAAIIELPGDEQLFIKMTGPRAAMTGLADGWDALITSMYAE